MLQVSRQAVYRTPTPRRRRSGGRPTGPVERAIVEVAEANQTDGYRMVAALTRQKLGRPVNRKRVLRVMRQRKLIQRRRPSGRRKRPGFFGVERPRQLWQLDMTSIWVAEHGWSYLNAIIDCCTREIVAWELSLRCRADEAIAVVERAAAAYEIQPGELALGTRQRLGVHRPPLPGATRPSSGSRTAAAATATPSPRPSSRPGSGS